MSWAAGSFEWRARHPASLAKGATAKFVLGTGTSALIITCKSSSFTAKVSKNPVAPGKATESITAESIGKCTASLMGLTVGKIKVVNLPYNSTVSDKKGLPVTISGTKKSKPIELKAPGDYVGSKFTCVYEAASIVGKGSNKGNTITITKQKFTVAKGSASICFDFTPSDLSAKYGLVKDTSVKGDPAVFVN
jgi:hypothetical protein